MSGITYSMSLCFTEHNVLKVHLCATCVRISFFFHCGVIFHFMYTPHSVYLLTCGWTFGLLSLQLLWTMLSKWVCILSFGGSTLNAFSYTSKNEDTKAHGDFVVLVFWGASLLFSIVAASIHIPTSRAWGIVSLHSGWSLYCLFCWGK